MTSALPNIAIRAFQILFAIVVLGLSVTLAKGHKWGSTPITLGYAGFVGGISVLAGFVGLAASWVEMLGGIIGMAIDVFIVLLNLAGGVLIAVKLKGINCSASFDNVDNTMKFLTDIIIGGCKKFDGRTVCYYGSNESALRNRCRMNQADSAFMFLTLIVVLVGLTLTFLRHKKGY